MMLYTDTAIQALPAAPTASLGHFPARRLFKDQRRHACRARAHQRHQAAINAGSGTRGTQMIVVEKAEVLRHIERAAPRAQRLGNGDHVAVGIGDRKRRRPRPDSRRRPARRIVWLRPLEERGFLADRSCERVSWRVRASDGRRSRREPLRVRHSLHLIAHLPRLEEVVEVVGVGGHACARARLIVLENLQRFEELNAGRDRWTTGIERVATILADDRLTLNRAILGEVGVSDDAAVAVPCPRQSCARSRRDRTCRLRHWRSRAACWRSPC